MEDYLWYSYYSRVTTV